jgi:hypothetical protein
MSAFELMEELMPILRSGNVEACVERSVRALQAAPPSPFHVAAGLDFTNTPEAVAAYVAEFLGTECALIRAAAVYTETNAFMINPDQWFFGLFAYESYGGHDDYDWLSDWQAESFDDMTLTGMEELQEVYASDAFGDRRYRKAVDFSDLVVVTKFQRLIERAGPLIASLRVPLLATSHDYDLIYEYRVAEQQED